MQKGLLALAGSFLLLMASISAAGETVNRPQLVLQTGHTSLVRSVVISPDGRWVATASFDTTIRIWETATGRELRVIAGRGGGIRAMAVSPDGRMLASSGMDGVVRVWNVESGDEIKFFNGLSGSIDSLAFSSDSGQVAAAGSDGKIWRLDLPSGTAKPIDDPNRSPINCLAVSPDGRMIAAGSADTKIRVFDLTSGKRLKEIAWHKDEVSSLRFDSSSTRLASGDKSGAIRLTKLPTGEEIASFRIAGPRVLAVAIKNNDTVGSADAGGNIRSFSVVTRKQVAQQGPDEERSKLGEPESAVFDQTGTVVVFGNGGGSAEVVDAVTGKRLSFLENNKAGVYGVAFSNDRRWMATASYDNTVKLWDLVTGQALPPLMLHQARVRSVVFHPDNRQLFSSDSDGKIIIWDTDGIVSPSRLEGHAGTVGSLAITPKGDQLVSAGADGRIGLWDIANRTPARFLTDHRGEVTAVAVGRNGAIAASAGIDGTLRLWNLPSGTRHSVIDPKAGELDAVAFSPDGRSVATAGIDKVIRLYEVDTGKETLKFTGHAGQVYSLAFSPDGRSISSGGIDGTVRSWPLEDLSAVTVFSGHLGSVFSVSYARNARQIVSASEDGSVIFWDVENKSRSLSILSLRGNRDWLVVSPLGYFDGSTSAWPQIAWRFDNNTFSSRPVEEFFSEFWYPGLLAELLGAGKLPNEKNIANKDRRQPAIKISLPETRANQPLTQRTTRVRLEISNAPAGAKDVRLFRNGSLVEFWRDDVLAGAASVTLETSVRIVAGENRFVAYAFNSDDIKSRDDSLTVTGAETLRRQGALYIVAVGVDRYANPEFDLAFSVRDADEFADEFGRRQKELGSFSNVEVIRLVDENATKAGIMKAISGIGSKTEPEDTVAVFYAGHGIADKDRFYLIPHDIAWKGRRAGLDQNAVNMIAGGGISDVDIQALVQDMGAERILLVIDACNSGKAIEAQETRRGPFNSKGLAQLAYEKGMYVLTASQGFQEAKENARLGNGYLTFALIEDGLKSAKADRNPKDNRIVLREWLDYTVERVPQIDREESEAPARKARKLEREKPGNLTRAETGFQRPRVFFGRETQSREILVATIK